MNIFKFDSPVMNFIGKVTDMVVLNILCLLCSLPIVTLGAAFTAKYYVSMKIVKGEETIVLKPFFRAFKENFKQATKIWLILLAVILFLSFDWFWIFTIGYGTVKPIFLILLLVATVYVIAIVLSVFPFIARYEVKTSEAIKAGALFAFLHFIPIVLIIALEIGSIAASIWYALWLPVILLFGTTTSFYFMNCVLVKGFTKMEKNLDPTLFENENPDDDEVESIVSDTEEDYSVLRADEHSIKGKIKVEKETFSSLSFKDKLIFIKDYYLLKGILIALAAVFILWFIYDGFIGKKTTIYSGGLLYCVIEDTNKEAFNNGLFELLADNKRKEQVNLSNDLTMDFTESNPDEVEYDASQDQYLFPSIAGGFYDYFLIDAKFIDHYMLLDCFKDVTYMADNYNIPEENRFYSEQEDENGNKVQYVSGFIIPSEVTDKAGIFSCTGQDIYIAFVDNKKTQETDDKFMEYLYSYEAVIPEDNEQ